MASGICTAAPPPGPPITDWYSFTDLNPMLTKLPPPPPKRQTIAPLQPKPSVITDFYDTGTYRMPMHDKYTPAWVKVLKDKGWPTDVLLIDFETYFDAEYSM